MRILSANGYKSSLQQVRQSQQQVDSISMSNGNLVVKFHQHVPFEMGGNLLVPFIYSG